MDHIIFPQIDFTVFPHLARCNSRARHIFFAYVSLALQLASKIAPNIRVAYRCCTQKRTQCLEAYSDSFVTCI